MWMRIVLLVTPYLMEAPIFFIMNDNDGHVHVKNQPQTPEEIAECERALASCPVDAIGNDGNY
jgi:ferredoxin